MQKEVNMKGEHLVVGSLEVLEEMSGKGVQAIRQGVQSAQDLIVKVSSRAEKFYKDAASDNIITPEEKKTLKRDFIEIQRTYSAILYQAEIKGLSDDPRIIGLTDAYDDLYGYLYTTIRVFEDMSANTVISSSEDMNEYYDTYFDAEMFAQAVLTQTALAYVRVLSSLDDPGLSNELGYYKGQLYRYVANEGWQAVSSGDYMGVVSSASALAEKGDVPDGSFFLCGSSFIVAEYRLTTSEGVMTTDGGNHFALTVRADAGDVWALEDGVWRRVPDRNDWRYILATNDLVALGFPISPSLEGEIRSVAQDAALELAPGKYLGPRTADPVSPALGEYYLYIGNTTLTRKNGAIYKYMRTSGGTDPWTELSSLDPANYQNYMAALSDMLAEDEQSLDTGRFSVVFARSLAAMSAMIETLMTQTLIVKSGGCIKSEDFDSGTGAGFKLSSNGVLEARSATFSGIVNATSGQMTNIQISGLSTFEGDIVSGPITITNNAPPAPTMEINSGMTIRQIINKLKEVFEDYYETDWSCRYRAQNLNESLSIVNGYNISYFYVSLRTDLHSLDIWAGDNLVYGAQPYNLDIVPNLVGYLTQQVITDKTLRINNLPTIRPVESGFLWNNNGVVNIS